MMVVVTITNCPEKLKGDLTRWFLEIDTGVFVGNLSARVRDNVWKRICDNVKTGRTTMVYSTNGEQKLDFKIYNADWIPVDFDGITLVKRKLNQESSKKKFMSKARINHINKLKNSHKVLTDIAEEYVCVDLETTGLDEMAEIIELAAIHICNGEIIGKYDSYIKISNEVPSSIVELTGITNDFLNAKGKDLEMVMKEFRLFCKSLPLVGHNIVGFDIGFIQRAFHSVGMQTLNNTLIDTMRFARKRLGHGVSLKLSSIADYYGIKSNNLHNALDDCMLTYRIYEKLKKN